MFSPRRLGLIRCWIIGPALALMPAMSLAQSVDMPPASSETVPPALLQSGATTLSVLLGEAQALYRKGNFDAALAKFQELLKEHPKSSDGYAGLVRVYLKQKNVDLAAQTAEQGLKQTDSPRMHVAHAEVLFRQGRINAAETEWVKVINSGYSEARAYLGIARVRDALAMYKSAKEMLDRAHELDPDDPDITDQWIETLSGPQRVAYIEQSLAGDKNWDADEHRDVANYLQYLRQRAMQKNQSPCRLVSKVTSTETSLVQLLDDPHHLRAYALNVYLNGRKSALMLDTGASGILVSRAVAERAGITRISPTKVGGIGKKGLRDAYVGIADSIKIGALEFQNCPIEVMESRSVGAEEGLIGADVLKNFLVDIDFPNEKLKLSPLPARPGASQTNVTLKSEEDDSDDDATNGDDAQKSSDPKSASKLTSSGPQDSYIAPEMKNYNRIYRFGHSLLITTGISQSDKGKFLQKLFLIETGSLNNFISPEAAREITKVHNDSDTIVEGISGRVDKVYSANKAVLTFGHLRQENQDMTAFDTKPISDSIGTEVSGFLGFTTLRMLDIKIDYRDGLVGFTYDAKRFGR